MGELLFFKDPKVGTIYRTTQDNRDRFHPSWEPTEWPLPAEKQPDEPVVDKPVKRPPGRPRKGKG